MEAVKICPYCRTESTVHAMTCVNFGSGEVDPDTKHEEGCFCELCLMLALFEGAIIESAND